MLRAAIGQVFTPNSIGQVFTPNSYFKPHTRPGVEDLMPTRMGPSRKRALGAHLSLVRGMGLRRLYGIHRIDEFFLNPLDYLEY